MKKGFRNLLLGLLVVLIFLGTFYLLLLPDRNVYDVELTAGQTLPHDITAPVDFSVPYDQEEFQEIRNRTMESEPIHLRRDTSVWVSLEERLYPRFLLATYDSAFSRGVLEELGSMYREGVFSLERVREYYDGEQAVLHEAGGTEDRQLFDMNDIGDVRETLEMRLGGLDLSGAAVDQFTSVMEPNLTVDDSSREVSARSSLEGLSNVDTTIAAGTVLLQAGEQASAETVEYLEYLKDSIMNRRSVKQTLSMVLLVLMIIGIAVFYVREIMPETWRSANRFSLLGTIWILSLAATGLFWLALRQSTGVPYATVVTFGAAMTSIFFHRRDAIFLTLLFSLTLGLVHPHPYSVALISSVSGILAALTVWDVRQRRSVPLAMGLSAAGGISVFLLLQLMGASLYSQNMLESVVGLLIIPVIGIGSANSLLFIFERIFGVYTVLSIEEVNKTEHPLLKKMREVAPGTWNHSQTVAELASRAAGAIGAWESLASAGGYFHDIGKMSDPEMFIENQRDIDNPHDSMNPWMSARKIISHVADGVKLAEKAKLPGAVIDIIRQHHGRSVTRFFYNKALKESSDPEEVKREDFVYPGPRPSSLEAALVLLADQVASATKNLTAPEGISEVVSDIVDEKDLEGELDDCHLTRRNLKTIARVFTSVLESKFYKRVSDYPLGDANG